MPYLQAATNNIFGLMPDNGPQGRTNLYSVSATETLNIFSGDALVWTSNGMTVRPVLTADLSSVNPWAGVAAGPLSTASFALGTFNLLVYDDPMQVYAIAVTTSLGMGTSNYGKAFNLVSSSTGTGVVSTALDRSKHALQVLASTVSDYLKMVGLHPVEALGPSGYVVTTSVGKPQKYLVMPNPSAFNTGIAPTT